MLKSMGRILIIAFAYAGVVVGAGNASGMEPLFYYTLFGSKGTAGVLLATLLYGVIGYCVVRIGQYLQVRSHKEAIYHLGGRYFGGFVDALIIFMMFGTGVVMIAGSGALFNQQYNLPYWLGALVMSLLVMGTLMLRLRQIIVAIGSITPILIILILIVVTYSLTKKSEPFSTLSPYAMEARSVMPGTLPNWLIASFNHVFMMTVAGVGMSLVIGGNEEQATIAGWGGLLGGLIIGGVLTMGHLALFSQIKVVAPKVNGVITIAEMPTLAIMNQISPLLSALLSIVALGMIYNTAVSMFYVFVARYVEMETRRSYLYIVVTLTIGFLASFAGFVQLVGYFYPIVGYLGVVVVIMILSAPIRFRSQKE